MGSASGTGGDSSTVLDALFPRTRQRVLGLLFGQPHRPFSMSELIRLAGAGSGAVQREVERLTDSGLATSDVDLLIVTDALTLESVFAATGRAEQYLGRIVSPTLYTAAEFHRRRKAKHPFLTKVLGGKHVVLLGSEDAIPAR